LKENNIERPFKNIYLGDYNFNVYGISDQDTYFSNINDNFEAEFYDFCNLLIKRGSVCIDIGANIGMKSLYLAKHVQEQGQVVAIEAAPTVFDLLLLNIKANNVKNITAINCAIGDFSGYTYFNDNSAYGHIANQGVKVRMQTLSDVVSDLALKKIDFIKIDVEGFEFPILRNSLNLINENKSLVLFEFNSWCQLAFSNINPREFIEWIIKNFSYVYYLSKGSLAFEQIKEEDVLKFLHKNLINDGCVTDILVTNEISRIDAIFKNNVNITRSNMDSNFIEKNLKQFDDLLGAVKAYIMNGLDIADLYPLSLEKTGFLSGSYGGYEKPAPNYNWTDKGGWAGMWSNADFIGVGLVGRFSEINPVIEKYQKKAKEIFFPYPEKYDPKKIKTDTRGQLIMVFQRNFCVYNDMV